MDRPEHELDLDRLDAIAAELGIAKYDADNRTRIFCVMMTCDATRRLTDANRAHRIANTLISLPLSGG